MMIGSAEELEDSKENIKPLKQGRVVSQLSMALKSNSDSAAHHEILDQQRYHELQIRSYEGDDPLEPWYDYVLWIEQSFVKDNSGSQLKLLLEKCLARFKDDPRYKQDLRYIKLWIVYIELQVHPHELYNTVYGHGIGTKSALFYRSWAYEFECIKDFKNADRVYRLAFENCAEPKEELELAHKKFLTAVAQSVLGYEVPVPEKPMAEQRLVLSKLHATKKGQVVSRVGSAVHSATAGKLKTVHMDANNHQSTFKIFTDGEAAAEAGTDSFPGSELQSVPRRELVTKENVPRPGPWNSAHRKPRPATSLVPTASAAGPQFSIHEDESAEPISVPPCIDLTALKTRATLDVDIKCPIAVFEEPDPTKRPMYCKNKVYAGNVEFSFEELRANVYRKKYQQQSSKVHEDELVKPISVPPCINLTALKGRMTLDDDIKCPIAVCEESDPTTRPMYCKNKVYAGNVEFSLEELRANVYRKKYQQQSFEGKRGVAGGLRETAAGKQTGQRSVVDEQPSAGSASLAAAWRCNGEPPSLLAHFQLQTRTPGPSALSPPQLCGMDGRVCYQPTSCATVQTVSAPGIQSRVMFGAANLEQSSLHSQSITVNTKEALRTVGALWQSPREEEQFIAPKMLDGDDIEQQPKSVPFLIYSDDESVCAPSKPWPQAVDQKPVENLRKVPHIKVHPPLDNLPCVVDKENQKFVVYHDDEDANLQSRDQSSLPKSLVCDIPYVPSPGRSDKELSDLEGSESKENIPPTGFVSTKKIKQNVTDGVLQPSRTVPFLSLEQQEALYGECDDDDDLGVQRLPDSSEISNETCNTQAFSIPLPSSTPFTIFSRKRSGDDHEPEEGTMNLLLCGVKRGEKQKGSVVMDHVSLPAPPAPAPPASALAPAPASAQQALSSTNLSVIMESSCECRSSSSSGSNGITRRRTMYSGRESRAIIEESSSVCEEEKNVYMAPQCVTDGDSRLVMNQVYVRLETVSTIKQFPHSVAVYDQRQQPTAAAVQPYQVHHNDARTEAVPGGKDLSHGFPVLGSLANLTIDSDFNPFSDEFAEMVLKKENFPKGSESDYTRCDFDLPPFRPSQTISLGSEKFVLWDMIGKGAYAKVMKATNLKTKEVVALKVQKSSCAWEFHISRQVRQRLMETSLVGAFIYPAAGFAYRNGSILVLEWLPYGSLLTVCNKYRERTGRTLNHTVASYWTQELLCIVRHLMKCNIIHGDVKPDNLMLRILPALNLEAPSLMLIDFGRSIDMSQFPAGTTFKKVVTTSGFQCIEMQTKRPWTYQTDLYGVAGTAHCLLFGSYMKTCQQRKSTMWSIEATIPRYCCRDAWRNFFDTLLNVESCRNIPDLLPLEVAFQTYLKEQKATLALAFINLNNILMGK